MKIQIRIALLFTLVCTSIIVALSFAIYYFANEEAFQDFFIRLELRAVIAAKANLSDDKINAVAYEKIRNEHLQRLPNEKEYIVKEDTLDRFLKTEAAKNFEQDFINNILVNKRAMFRDGYHFYEGILYETSTDKYIVIISAEHAYAKDFLANLRFVLIIGCLISMLVVFTIGIVFSKRILLPIRNITRSVKKISATSLHERLEIRKGKDEITDLANTFNDMISRLEMSFETQNNFVSNASHELNTPLTSIIGEADYALSKTLSQEQYVNAIKSILTQAERLRDVTKGLLELARSGLVENFSMTVLRLDEVIYNVQKIAKQVYPKSQIEVDYSLYPDDSDNLSVLGNAHLIELAISNIVLNSCKYSAGKHVTIALAVAEKNVVIIVKDNGIGIPQKDMVHIFDPFFRASNVQGTGGYGIGLPLTKNILKVHNGSIDIHSKENEGTEVIVKLPVYSK
jgi:signal transduction histidine kinase